MSGTDREPGRELVTLRGARRPIETGEKDKMTKAKTYAGQIAELLRSGEFGAAEALFAKINDEYQLKRWECSALSDMIWQRLGDDSEQVRAAWCRAKGTA